MTSDGIRRSRNGSVRSAAGPQITSRNKMLWLNWNSTSVNFPLGILIKIRISNPQPGIRLQDIDPGARYFVPLPLSKP